MRRSYGQKQAFCRHTLGQHIIPYGNDRRQRSQYLHFLFLQTSDAGAMTGSEIPLAFIAAASSIFLSCQPSVPPLPCLSLPPNGHFRTVEVFDHRPFLKWPVLGTVAKFGHRPFLKKPVLGTVVGFGNRSFLKWPGSSNGRAENAVKWWRPTCYGTVSCLASGAENSAPGET